MGYLSLYRKYRPQTFAEVISQEHVIRTLQNALRMRRTAHAYLFAGPRGTGKTTVARLLAKALNCQNGPAPEPCNECASCRQIRDGLALDVIEIDGASNRGIEEIRDLREKVKLAAAESHYKVYIIDEIHMLTTDAFNALLKTLEEPPAHVVFIFATTEAHKIPATILSRCQRFDFKRLTVSELTAQLVRIAAAESLEMSPETAALIARNAEGGLRDALSLLDQIVAFAGERITLADVETLLGTVQVEVLLRFVDLVADRELVGGLELIGRLIDDGKDLHRLSRDLMGHLRNLLFLQLAPNAHLISVEPEVEERLRVQAGRLTRQQLVASIEILAEAEAEIRWASQDRLPLELALIRLVGLVEERPAAGRPASPPVAPPEPAAVQTGQAETAAALAAESAPAEAPALPTGLAPAAGVRAEFSPGQWQAFLEHLVANNLRNMASVFRQGEPELLPGAVRLRFPATKGFYYNKAIDAREQMERAVRRFFGEEFQFLPFAEGETPPPVPAASATAPAAGGHTPAARGEDPRSDPLVRKAIELFGATVVRVEPSE
ncbi:MAG: DNA polymerase III subunit gamma/tau [Chitinophagales bacterium]